jgi:hypothetical protein
LPSFPCADVDAKHIITVSQQLTCTHSGGCFQGCTSNDQRH